MCLLKKYIGLLSASTIRRFGEPFVSSLKRLLKCVSKRSSIKSQTALVNIKFNENNFCLSNVSVKNGGGNCSTFDDPCKLKNINLKVFNLRSELNKTRFLVQLELCELKCGLNKNKCNLKPELSHDECRCECKELDDWSSCKDGYMSNCYTCDCECNKTCKTNQYLDIKNWPCEKRELVNQSQNVKMKY